MVRPFLFALISLLLFVEAEAVTHQTADQKSDVYVQTGKLNAGQFLKCQEPRTTDIKELVRSRTWFHSIDFGNGIVSNGYDPTRQKALKNVMSLPDSLAGKSVLDIGAYDGGWTFEAVRRGAAKVVSADYFAWFGKNRYHFKNFCIARALLNKTKVVTPKWIPVEELVPERFDGELFDVVFFFGILYHADNPVGYLRHVLSVTKPGGLVLIETVVDMLDVPYPAAAFYEGLTLLNGDATNDFGPNELGVLAMMRKAGFVHAKVGQRNYINLLKNQMTSKARRRRVWSDSTGAQVPVNARSTFIGYAPGSGTPRLIPGERVGPPA